MKFYIGTVFSDPDQNVYQIVDTKNENTHSQHASSYLCYCHEGNNAGREMWVMRKTMLSMDLKEV